MSRPNELTRDISGLRPGYEYREIHVIGLPPLHYEQVELIFREYGTIVRMEQFDEPVSLFGGRANVLYTTGQAATRAVESATGVCVNRCFPMEVGYNMGISFKVPEPQSDTPTAWTAQSEAVGMTVASRGIMVTGPGQMMDNHDLLKFFHKFGAVEDIACSRNGRPWTRVTAIVVFDSDFAASRAIEAMSDPSNQSGYHFSKRVPNAEVAVYDNRHDRTIYIGHNPRELITAHILPELGRLGFVARVVQLGSYNDGDSYLKVQFGKQKEAAHAIESINTNGFAGYRSVRAERSLAELRENVFRPRIDRRPGAPDPPSQNTCIFRSILKRRIEIHNTTLGSGQSEHDIFVAMSFYDQPGTDYAFSGIARTPYRHYVISFRTHTGAVHNLARMAGENFGGLTVAEITLIE